MFSFVFAATNDFVIGKNNGLPWNIPEDMKVFKELTTNHTIIMGRKTFQSINRSLPKRKIIVLTRDVNFKVNLQDVSVSYNLQEIIQKYSNTKEEIMVVGGAEIFSIFLPYCSIIHFSKIKKEYSGDIYLPKIDWENYIIKETKEFNDFTYNKYIKKIGN